MFLKATDTLERSYKYKIGSQLSDKDIQNFLIVRNGIKYIHFIVPPSPPFTPKSKMETVHT